VTSEPSHEATQNLLAEICHCPVIERCLDTPQPCESCAGVVLSQWDAFSADDRQQYWRERHQLPEPWVGHLDEARILFVSSNPSIRGTISLAPDAPAPTLNWHSEHERVRDRYERAFELYIEDGVREQGKRATAFWVAVKHRAQELLCRPPIPGRDYVLTEVVHCKSRKERGVAEARGTCSERYLERVIAQTPAPVIIFLGAHADRAAHHVLGVSPAFGRHSNQRSALSMVLSGRSRVLAFLPHPNYRGERTPKACWTDSELELVRSALRLSEAEATPSV
jgi:hypothetical protein